MASLELQLNEQNALENGLVTPINHLQINFLLKFKEHDLHNCRIR